VIDEEDRLMEEKRVGNDLGRILLFLAKYRDALVGVVVESTFNWYWLVDGLQEEGYRVHLANPAAIDQYKGIKHKGDEHDARWLAHLLRLAILREGYIYPKLARGVRDLMRRRMQLVQTRSAQFLAMQTQLMRSAACTLRKQELSAYADSGFGDLVKDTNVDSALRANLALIQTLSEQIERLEKEILQQAKIAAQFAPLKTIPGVGMILALCIMLETGEIGRFAKVGNYASYARCVDSRHESNGKKKGEGNKKCGNRYLAWAFVEAAHFAVRYSPRIRRFYERKAAKTNKMVAIKACAHKMARAAYHIMRTHEAFDEARAFA
jgi:transposase